MTRGFVHAKWRWLRAQIPAVRTPADILANPVLSEQILSTIEPPVDFVKLCRDLDPAGFADLTARFVPEPAPLDALPASSIPALSEKTASIIYYCLRLRRLAPRLSPGPVVEIGGGLGLLATMLLETGVATEYHIVDLPEMMAVQRVFFAEAGVDMSRIHFHDVLDLDAGRPPPPELARTRWALAVSTWGLTETTPAFQEWAAGTLLAPAAAVYLVGQSTFHGQDVSAHLRSLLTPRFAVISRPFIFASRGVPSVELFGAAADVTTGVGHA